ncbi:MAG TPA: hypothetical protein VMD02_05760 [Candidatus Omnitrophota bacterium]|nr:hypothetical protein [Candidatus Omnitrophota bacterium]
MNVKALLFCRVTPPSGTNAPSLPQLVKANLTGNFNVQGMMPLPLCRSATDPVSIHYFNDSATKWTAYDISSITAKVESIRNSQLLVTEAPVKVQLGVTSCAAITLYDRERKVGAAMHFHNMDESVYRGYLSIALMKMGVVDTNRLSRVEARIMGVRPCEGLIDRQNRWVREIRSFLESLSVRVLPDDVGQAMMMNFNFNDGEIEDRRVIK